MLFTMNDASWRRLISSIDSVDLDQLIVVIRVNDLRLPRTVGVVAHVCVGREGGRPDVPVYAGVTLEEIPDQLVCTCEGEEYEHALQGVERYEGIPQGLVVDVAGEETHTPSESHDQGEPYIEPEVPLRTTTGCEARETSGGVDHVSGAYEEEDVEYHDDSQWQREEYQQRQPLSKPATRDAEVRFVLGLYEPAR